MTDGPTEVGVPRSESQLATEVEKIQTSFVRFLKENHERAARGRTAEIFNSLAYDFDTLYRKIPENNHLELSLTSGKWYALKGNNPDFGLLSKINLTPTGSKLSASGSKV